MAQNDENNLALSGGYCEKSGTPWNMENPPRGFVILSCGVWGAVDSDRLVGFIAFRSNWIDQLYVLPDAQGRGVGTSLLRIAQTAYPTLHLWTFQRNLPARRFYEARGFLAIKETDGEEDEAREPDVLYRWIRPEAHL